MIGLALALFAVSCGDDDRSSAGDDPDDGNGQDEDGGTMPSLAGKWVLTGLTTDGQDRPFPFNDAGQAIAPEMEIEAGQISGNGGCNQFGGEITIDSAESLAISDLFMTEMACMPMELMDFESDYLAALSGVTGWSADPTGIVFTSDSARITYNPAPPVEHAQFEETTWELDSIYSGEGANRAVSSADMSAPAATLVLSAQNATLTAEDCEPITFPVSYEPGRDGSFRISESGFDPSCDNANISLAWSGLEAATGFMINERRLTFIGIPGETIGFVAR
jgi:heat shock protein HslJ